jgi:transposase
MSLRPHPLAPIPEETVRIARAAFPKGNPYLTLRDHVGLIFHDHDFADLYAHDGQPGLAPWRLALVTLLQFRENLADRQAAEAVRARIDWKYLLGLALTDSGFDFSVLSEFRNRLVKGDAAERLLAPLLTRCQELGLLKARGQQRTDATHVLAAIRVLHRLELLGETLRATLNDLATVAPGWLQGIAPLPWYERYSKRVEDARLPKVDAEREAYAQQVGADGFALLEALEAPEVLPALRERASVVTLRRLWQQHFERARPALPAAETPALSQVRVKPPRALPLATDNLESPYDVDARYRRKRNDVVWTGYMVHVSETCGTEEAPLLTHVHTTAATVHEAQCTAPIHQGLAAKGLLPAEHFVDAAYIDAELLVRSRQDYAIDLIGPTRPNVSWQTTVDGAYRLEQFAIDWEQKQVRCPQGHLSSTWTPQGDSAGSATISVQFRPQDCTPCPERARCTRAKTMPRHLQFRPREQFEALEAARVRLNSEAGKTLYRRRAGIEGTLSQGVRAFGLRRTRYRGFPKTHMQHVATAAAMNIERLFAWLEERPRATTRTSRFAALTPADALMPGEVAA